MPKKTYAVRYAKVRQSDIDAIAQDREPFQRARSMAEAVAGFIYELYMDDPGDEGRGYVKELRRAQIRAEKVVNSLAKLAERG